ncbi:MAG: hypothetical protein H6755_01490, partial [Candidatus Omnitrophica bacterium]|nr:hypothetical protein [Candidatus Omnitrophota bacterium]
MACFLNLLPGNSPFKDMVDQNDNLDESKTPDPEENILPESQLPGDENLPQDQGEGAKEDLSVDSESGAIDSDAAGEGVQSGEANNPWVEKAGAKPNRLYDVESLKSFVQSEKVSQGNDNNFEDFVQSDQGEPEFRSRFGTWFRTIALAVVLIFVPEQFSWAFNYNPLVLWGNESGITETQLTQQTNGSEKGQVLSDAQISARIAGSVQKLLKQVAYKDKSQINLQLPNRNSFNEQVGVKNLLINSDVVFTEQKINDVTKWLSDPDIHPLNCGVWALKDVLDSAGVNASLDELSVSTLLIDLMSDIVQPGEAKLKTSLFAINKVTDAYGLNFRPAKIDPKEVPKLQTPFIANFDAEHFVTVTSVKSGQVYYNDIGQPQTASLEEFIPQLSGYVLASDLESKKDQIAFESVPEEMTAYVWGNKWVDRSDDLPGLTTAGEIALAVGMELVQLIILAVFCAAVIVGTLGGGTGACVAAAIVYFGAKLGQQLALLCYNEGACSEEQAFIISTAVTAAAAAVSVVAGNPGAATPALATNAATAAIGAVAAAYAAREAAEAVDEALGDDTDPVLRQALVGLTAMVTSAVAGSAVRGGLLASFEAAG